jgi:hypothetical protein
MTKEIIFADGEINLQLISRSLNRLEREAEDPNVGLINANQARESLEALWDSLMAYVHENAELRQQLEILRKRNNSKAQPKVAALEKSPESTFEHGLLDNGETYLSRLADAQEASQPSWRSRGGMVPKHVLE